MSSFSKSNEVFDFVISKIRSGEWAPGAKIFTEPELCSALNASRVAVREALERCSALGIVEKRKGAGTFVCDINLRSIMQTVSPLLRLSSMDVEEIMNFRIYFEVGNVINFIKYADESDYKKLVEAYDNMLASSDDVESFPKWDHAFHTIIAEGTHNPIIIFMNSLLTDTLAAAYDKAIDVIGSSAGIKWHKLILDAMLEKDADLSSLLMQRHIEDSRRIMLG